MRSFTLGASTAVSSEGSACAACSAAAASTTPSCSGSAASAASPSGVASPLSPSSFFSPLLKKSNGLLSVVGGGRLLAAPDLDRLGVGLEWPIGGVEVHAPDLDEGVGRLVEEEP